MATTETQFRIAAIVQGLDGIESLKNAVKGLQTTTAPAAADLNKLKEAATALGNATGRTERDLRTSIDVLKTVRSNIALTDAEYQKLTKTINGYSKALEESNGASRVKNFGRTAGAIAASGVFGGPEGLVGAGIGSFFGPEGALAGGAIGAQIGQVRQSIGDIADYASMLGRLNIALKGVAGSADEYARAQTAINRVSKELNVPVLDATQGFTRLAAAVRGAGGNINDAEVVFRGISQAIKATGGNAEDVQSSLLAMSQVFSKGKVQAEELQGQLGERLPGAVTLFAEATHRTLPQLAKDLQNGTVGLNDLMKFAAALSEKYAIDAAKMAKSTDDAGARMQTSLDKLKLAFGNFFKPAGAMIQDFIGKLADMGTATVQAFELTDKYEKARKQATDEALKKYGPGPSALQVLFGAKDTAPEINAYIQRRTKELVQAMSMQSGPKPSLTTFEEPKGTGSGSDEEERKIIRDQSELNRLIQENLKLNTEAGNIGKDRLSQLDAELSLAKELTRLRKLGAGLETDNEKNRQQIIKNAEAEYQKEKARIAEQRKQTLEDIANIGAEAKILQEKFFNKTDKTESPLTRELNNINLQIDEAVKNADVLLKRLNDKGGINPETKKARIALGGFKGQLEDLTPQQKNAMASGNLLQGDFQSLRQQIEELRNAGRELTTLDRLKQKYLGDWDKLDPTLRSQAEALASQVDHLRQMQQITDSIANSLGTGLTSAFDALIQGTQNWGNSLRQIASTVLQDIAKQLIKILVIDQAINAFKSIFNFGGGGGGAAAVSGGAVLTAANGYAFAQNGIQPFAMGGVITSPTLFKFADGGTMRNGLLGEAGPEAIIPLKRGVDGKLGVAGGGGTVVNVSVDAKGTSVQGDNNQGAALGRVIAGAVQAELIKQKRPGGLLAA